MKTVISIRFRGGCKLYYFDPGALTVAEGQDVIVETAQGMEFAQCVQGNHEVEEESIVQPLSPVVRLATDADRRTLLRNGEREKEAAKVCQKKIAQHGLEMKLVDVSCNFEGNKIIFFFTSDGRVDFRELVKDLAAVFRARIELRQIGVRDEAKMLGGLGICGRPFCCASFLDGFLPVSIKMAKTQSLSLNPTKISGTCGRLMCCLKYEQDAYEDAARRMPKNDSFVLTPDGPGNVTSVDLLRETAKVSLDGVSGAPKCYHNCELCVLRNGKGSREGIEIPAERPQRYVNEEEIPSAEEFLRIPVLEEYPTPAEEERPSENRRRRSRSRGNRGRGGEGRSEAPGTERSAKPSAKPGEKPRKPQPPKGERSEKAAPGERPAARADRPPRQDKPRKPTPPPAAATEGGAPEHKPRRRRPYHRNRKRSEGGGNEGRGE